MMIKLLLSWLSGLGLLLLSQAALAAGPCPDGNFNPQNQVCMCPGGGYVAPGDWCSPKNKPIPRTWGAIAVDTSPAQKRNSFRKSLKSQADAERKALEACGLPTCQVALSFRNSCGAITADGKGIWGGAVDIDEKRALQKAADACYAKGAKDCYKWGEPVCAAAPR